MNNVFIESFFKKKIYMKSSSNVDITSNQMLLIKRSLYKLKQIVKDWHEKCIKTLIKLDFVQIFADSCLLRHSKRDIILFVYVDDVNIVARSMHQVNWFKKKFKRAFKIKNLKKMNKILDFKITRNRQNWILHMNQEHYFIDVLARFNMTIDKHRFTKFFINEYNALCFVESNDKRINQKNYQHAIKSIMYAAIHTRSNIAFAIERFNQYFSDFVEHHKQALKHLLRYIRSTVNKGIKHKVIQLIFTTSKNLSL